MVIRWPLLARIGFYCGLQCVGTIVQPVLAVTPRNEVREMSICLGWWSVEFPAQTEVHGQIGAKFPVILGKRAVNRRPEVPGLLEGWATRDWIHFNLLENGCPVGEIPRTLEDLIRPSATDQFVVVLLVTILEAKLPSLVTHHLGEHIAKGECVFCCDFRSIVTLLCSIPHTLATRKTLNFDTRNGPVDLRVRGDAVKTVAREIEPGFVERGGVNRSYPGKEGARAEGLLAIVCVGSPLCRSVGRESGQIG